MGPIPAPLPNAVLVCGGGALNADLMARLARALPRCAVGTTATAGIAPEHVEAAGFAWLAHRYVCGLAGNLPARDRCAPPAAARRAVPRAPGVAVFGPHGGSEWTSGATNSPRGPRSHIHH